MCLRFIIALLVVGIVTLCTRDTRSNRQAAAVYIAYNTIYIYTQIQLHTALKELSLTRDEFFGVADCVRWCGSKLKSFEFSSKIWLTRIQILPGVVDNFL